MVWGNIILKKLDILTAMVEGGGGHLAQLAGLMEEGRVTGQKR